jgi:hypothetical protein
MIVLSTSAPEFADFCHALFGVWPATDPAVRANRADIIAFSHRRPDFEQ